MDSADEMPCSRLVELLTAYLDDSLPAAERSLVDAHLDSCEGCRNVLAQWRTVIETVGRLSEADVTATDDLTRDRLTMLFRDLRHH